MPYTKEHKQRSKDRILNSAVKLFSQRGFNKVSIDEIMQYAGMTRGAFYAHFHSKEELYAEAIMAASKKSKIYEAIEKCMEGEDMLKNIINFYLDRRHVEQQFPPCPLAFLVTDVANEETKVRETYTQVYQSLVVFMTKHLSPGKISDEKDRMMAVTAMMIGGVAVSRALVDKKTVDSLLASCRRIAHQLVTTQDSDVITKI